MAILNSSHRQQRTLTAVGSLLLLLSVAGCGGDNIVGSPAEPRPAMEITGAPASGVAVTVGEGSFPVPEDADRTDVESTAETAALMLHSWDTAIDRTQTAAAVRAKPLMSTGWAAHQVEPDRNGAQGAWLEPAQHQAYSAPSLIPAAGDVSRDVAADKAIRAYDVSWRWINRDRTELPETDRQLVTVYLENHEGIWYVVGHQFQKPD